MIKYKKQLINGGKSMNYQILGDSDCPLAQVNLGYGETIQVERGAMAYSSNVDLQGKMNTNKSGIGGLFSALGRSLTSGESFFMTHATGQADGAFIGIAPAVPGKITSLTVGPNQYRLNTGVFLACDSSVGYNMVSQNVGGAFFGGTGGLFVMETQGQGEMLISAFGDIIELTVTPDHPLTIDNEHVIAWDSSLDYNIKVASGTFGFTTGEGLVNVFHGNGRVLIQTRNLRSLAETVDTYLPKSSNS